MTDIQAILERTGVKVNPTRFLKPMLPRIVWFERTNCYGADFSNPIAHRDITVELYAEKIDLRVERRIAAELDALGVDYSTERIWVSDEKLFETIYNFELEEKRN
ncbi:MAG: hypothetical protein IJT41_13030 [Clostridia bacterium]|nr:hypothetical protein [Clostridia bacterium]